ncbi:MAG: hypothetical protein COB88_05875 [Flavobacteriales bacterium]|nr:MAG: hypothetical protein COB88_05875 [Flavobacteriales bacterium]
MNKSNQSTLKMDPKMCPMMRLSVLSRKIGKLFRKRLSKLNVSQSQTSILLMVSGMGEVAQSTIGKYLELERSTVSRDLVGLIDKGYLYKTATGVSPTISLTQDGKKMADLVTQEWEKGYQASFQILGSKGMNAISEIEKTMQ